MIPSTPSPALECRQLSCGFPHKVILRGVDLAILPGTVMGILGPNGSGKSTLLNTIAGCLPALAGDILLGSTRLTELNAKERASQIAFVPQFESTDFGFTGLEIAAMGRIARSTGLFETDEDRAVAQKAMESVGAADFATRRFRELSGGEQQRVLIARALAQQTPIVLMDEPSSHLDLAHQADLVRLTKQLAAEGKAILVAVHDLNWAAAAVDRAVLLSEGKLLANSPMAELLRGPELEAAFRVPLIRINQDDDRLVVLPNYD